MDFYPHSEIRIGKFAFSGVHEVRIHRSMHSVQDTATIVLPGKGAVQKGKVRDDGSVAMDGNVLESSTGSLFAAGDEVNIKLGWNGELVEEFAGVVRRVGRGLPVEVECESYAWYMRRNISLSGVLTSTTAKQLLEMAVGMRDVKGKPIAKPLTPVTVECNVDIPLSGLELTNANGLQLVDYLKKVTDNNVAIFFKSPKVLWCGLPFTAYANGSDAVNVGSVAYRPGWNCLQDGALRERVVNDPVQVYYGGKYATSAAVWTKSKQKTAARKVRSMLNNITKVATLQKLADEKELRLNYGGYEGRVSGFLQPFCAPGYSAQIVNKLYPDMDGKYMVEAVDVTYGVRGARRSVSIGPRIGFGKK